MATLRPLLQNFLWRIGLAAAPSPPQPRIFDRSSKSAQKCQNSQRYRSMGLGDLVPTREGTTSITVSGGCSYKHEKSWIGLNKEGNANMNEEHIMNIRGISRSVVVEQEHEGPPRLPVFRNSLRNSFIRGSIFSSKTYNSLVSSLRIIPLILNLLCAVLTSFGLSRCCDV